MGEEEELCKLIKCGYLAAAKIGSTESVVCNVPDAVPREKRQRVIAIYERLYNDLDHLGL